VISATEPDVENNGRNADATETGDIGGVAQATHRETSVCLTRSLSWLANPSVVP
jgi:hypothetical protein